MAVGLIGALRATLGLDTAEFEAGSTKAQAQLRGFQREFEKVGKRWQNIGKDMTKWISLPIVGAGVAVAKLAGDFQASMNSLQVNAGATEKQLASMRKEAIAIGQDTTKSASDAADAMNILAKAGMKAEDILNGGAKAAVNLATATGSELDPAAAAITDTMNQFKLTAKDLPFIINNITGAVNESKFDFDDFQMGMAQAGGVASSMGVKFEDFTKTLAGTAYMFQSGSDAGTSFKTFLQRLNPQTKQAANLMKEYGLEFFDAQGKMKSMSSIAQLLQDKFKGLDDQTRSQVFTKIFGSDAIRTAIALMNQGAAGLDAMQKKIADTSATEQAAARMKGFNGQLEQLKGTLETLAIAIADSGFLDAITSIVAKVAEWVNWMSKAHPETLKWITIVAAAAAAMGPLVMVFGTAIRTIGFLLPLLTKLGPLLTVITTAAGYMIPVILGVGRALMVLVANPIGLTITAIAVAVLAVYEAWKHWDEIKAIAMAVYMAVKTYVHDKLNAIWDAVGAKIKAVGDWFHNLWDRVVGHSYIPDMVDAIGMHMARLDALMVQPAKKATSETAQAFAQLQQQVSGLLTRLFPEEARNNQFLNEVDLLTKHMKEMGFTADETAAAVARLRDEYLNDKFGKDSAITNIENGSGDQGSIANDNVDLSGLEKANKDVLDHIAGITKDKTAEMVHAWADMAQQAIGSVRGMVSAFKSGDILGGIQGLLDVVLKVTQAIGGFSGGGGGAGGFNFGGMPTGFSTGGSFKVGGSGGTDSQLVSLRASPGEMINVRRGDQMDLGGGGAIVVHIDKSKYFDTAVERVAGPIGDRAAVRGALGGSEMAQRAALRRQRSSLP
jgi:TP901 family phage tail tape measure protein